MHIRTPGIWTTFKRDDRGVTAMTFAITALALIMCVGCAIDYGRAQHYNSKMGASLDAAALAGAKALREQGLSAAEVATLARRYFDSNMDGHTNKYGTVTEFNVQVDTDKSAVAIDAKAVVPTLFAAAAGYDKIEVGKSSAAVFNLKDIELGMALDITGSMGGAKIEDLKTAAKDLVDILLANPTPAQKVRIAMAPYAAAVNAGSYANVATDGASQDGCVIERTGFNAYTDAAPAPGRYMNAENPSTPANGNYSCPVTQLLPLSNDKAALKTHIDTFSPAGYTAGHLGAAWAWYTVSPEWNTVWGGSSQSASYGDKKTIKAVILMTDGIFNTSYKNGPQNATSSVQAKDLCDSMKGAGKNVLVYAVGFKAPASAKDTLKYCATSGSHYFDATDGAQLKAAFQAIAKDLSNIRLAK